MRYSAQDVRPSPLAGQWYPASPAQLRQMVESLLAAAEETSVNQPVQGIVVPHAGYRYSGSVAAGAFRALQGQAYERVIIMSPMHHPSSGKVLTTAHTAYETPLGTVPVDTEFITRLGETVSLHKIRDDPEHAVEIELPFLQMVLADAFELVPLMLRKQSYAVAEQIGEALADLIDTPRRTLLVASSDLSHFYTDAQARQFDSVMLDQIEAFDPLGVIRIEREQKAFACGRGAVAATLIAAQRLGAQQAQVVAYGTSADAGAGKDRVVGYGAALIY